MQRSNQSPKRAPLRLIISLLLGVLFVNSVVLFWPEVAEFFNGDGNEDEERRNYVSEWNKMKSIQPRRYLCNRIDEIVVDGAEDSVWSGAPWTEEFLDICGVGRRPSQATRSRLAWNDEYLYIFAQLTESDIWATIVDVHTPIYFDNDFELFIDPDGDRHNYFELEVNALGTMWPLHLPKPYIDGGDAIEVTNDLKILVGIKCDGTLNDPSDQDKSWFVELGIPWRSLRGFAGKMSCPPNSGDSWYVNFSRVHWQHRVVDGNYQRTHAEDKLGMEENWVWSPQGVVDMHRPERWGVVRFVDQSEPTPPRDRKQVMSLKQTVLEIYYHQKEYFQRHGNYAGTLRDLGLDRDVKSAGVETSQVGMSATESGYGVFADRAGIRVTISDDGRLSVAEE